MEETLPGMADHLEPADPGMHTTATVDFEVVLAGTPALELDDDALALTWRSLREIGNLSSASVLFVLAETLERAQPKAGEYGLVLAMGPCFCSELVLLQW